MALVQAFLAASFVKSLAVVAPVNLIPLFILGVFTTSAAFMTYWTLDGKYVLLQGEARPYEAVVEVDVAAKSARIVKEVSYPSGTVAFMAEEHPMSRVKDFLVKPWRPEVAGLVIGIVASLQILVIRSPWYITGPETQFGGWLLKTLTLGAVKVDLWDYFNPSSPMDKALVTTSFET